MDIIEEVHTGADPAELFDLVVDLDKYSSWFRLVSRADVENGTDADPRGSWIIELRGRVGPLSRAKRLRMVRVTAEPPRLVRFERAETDGRRHAEWSLEAEVVPAESGATLRMKLHYGGSRFAPMLEPILAEEIHRGRRELLTRYPRTD